MKKILRLCQKFGEKPIIQRFFPPLMLLAVSLLQYIQIHFSAVPSYRALITLGPVLLNVAIMLWLNLAAKMLLQKWYISVTVTSVLTTAWSIADFYIVKFHGSPLFFSEFASFGTAVNVMGEYHYEWVKRVTLILLLGLANLAAAFILYAFRKREERYFVPRNLLLSSVAFVAVSVLLWLSLFVWEYPKPRDTVAWTWRVSVVEFGYPAVIVEDVDRSLHILNVPEDYSVSHMEQIQPEEAECPEVCPDIILIINETFWDPKVCTDLTTDVDYMEDYYNIPGAVYGFASVPNIGGGTNDTEFEVLTGNSMSLLPRHAPFNYFKLNKDETGAPRYLKALGYRSAALHCRMRSNYSRNTAYPAMGFDEAVLGRENYIFRTYGGREHLDEDNYTDMLRIGESLGEGPRFIYLLTYQNHGGWQRNDPEYDTVHVQEDFGEYTDDLNEFLTSIRMSGEAFRSLTEQIDSSERPTVICMVGDHSASFAQEILTHSEWSEEEKQLRLRLMPYVIWANFELDLPEQTDYASAVDLMAMVYRSAGLPVSAYQNYILSVHDRIPVRTENGLCMDADGRIGKIKDSPYEKEIQLYYEMEYNALSRSSDYKRDLFVCPVSQ